tara:strand:- start:1465 stop:2082 length:618 start_codon:yes stop_codon:yes gene_type:complete
MALTFDGSNNTIGGLAVGGLPDGVVQIADLGATSGKNGPILQIEATNVAATSSFAFTTAAAGVATPATVTITSLQANSKFLISGSLSGETTRDDYEVGIFLVRSIGGTATAINVGTASGNSKAISQIKNQGYHGSNNASTTSSNSFSNYLDSPNQSAGTAITYVIYVMGMNESGTFYVNRTKDNSDHAGHERPSSHITVIEVAAA